MPWPWLYAGAVHELESQVATDEASEPFRWGRGLEMAFLTPVPEGRDDNLVVLAHNCDAEISHPLLEPAFVAALADQPRAARFANRREAMTALFQDVLPAELIARRSKAHFDGAFWHESSRGARGAVGRNWSRRGPRQR